MKTKTITLKKVGYYVEGTSDLTMWGGGNGSITMTPFKVNNASQKELLKGINDAQFGVQSINGAICDIYELYEGDYKEYLKTVVIGKVSEDTSECHYNN
jgi:hypothetical protein